MKEYVTLPSAETVTETIIEKSRFIAAVIHVDSAEQAAEFVDAKRKRYFDATHNCYAYICGDRAKFSDDGEPQGTAGMPMYECLKNSGLDYVCAVVTRYFGGTKLGAGGLVRAYSGAVAEALKLSERVNMTDCVQAEVVVEYSLLKPMRRALEGVTKEKCVEYGNNVRIVYLFPAKSYDTISHIVSETSLGKAELKQTDRLLCEYK